MYSRVLRPALLVALLFACNSGSSSDNGDDGSPSGSSGGSDQGSTGGAGNNGTASSGGTSSGGTSGGTSSGGSSGGSSSGNTPIDPGPPAVQYIGRFDKSDPNAPRCAYAGCRIVIRFEGTTKVTAKLQEEFYDWMEGAPSEWDVIVDGQTKDKIVMTAAETEFVLADGLASQGAHVVELYKRSEPQTGTTKFAGYDLNGGTLLSPPARKTRRIEIVGDSSSTGYGVEGVGLTDSTGKCPGFNHAAKYENFRKAYGAVLGGLVDAEVYSSALSGKGIYQNIWSEDFDTLPMLFPKTLPMTDQSDTWDFSWKPDVVIVMAGGNDFAIRKPNPTPPATLEQFTQAYRDLVAKMRTEYPAAHLVLTVSPTTDDQEPAGSNTRTNIKTGAQTVATERNGAGDAKVYFFEPVKAQKSEMTGCFGHGSPEYHQRVAKEFETFIKPKLGW